MSRFYDPNVILALAASYDTRGLGDGYAQGIVNGYDQRKVNSMYEPVKNSFTGRTKLLLKNRPGFSLGQSGGAMASSDACYLVSSISTEAFLLQVYRNGNNTRGTVGSTSSTITSGAGIYPVYADQTNISGVRETVVQLYNSTGANYRAFHASSATAWTEIGSNYTSFSLTGKMEHLDGYAFQLDVNNRIRNSSVNSLDLWGTNDFVTKSQEQDYPVGMARLGNVLLAFGRESAQGYYNAGRKSASPLAPIKNISAKVGLYAPNGGFTNFHNPRNGDRSYYAVVGGRLYFAGDGAGEGIGLYAFDGSRFEKVSPPSIDKIMQGAIVQSEAGFLNISPLGVYDQPAVVISFNHPTTSPQRWLMYFPAWNDWFEWNSLAVQPIGDGNRVPGIGTRGSATNLFTFLTGGNREYALDGGSIVTVGGSSYTMLHQFKLPKEDNGKARMDFCALVGDTALDNANANVSTSLSYDGYSTFTYAGAINMSGQDKSLSRLGAFKEAEVRLEYSGSTQIRLEKFIARVRK